MIDPAVLAPWIRRFLLEHLVGERNLSRNTQQSYRDTFCLLLPFVARHGRKTVDRLHIQDLTAGCLQQFLASLESDRQCAVSTRNQRLSAIHAFSLFVGERSPENLPWCREIRSIPFKRSVKHPLGYLDKPELDALLAAPKRETEQGRRDYALLLFLYNSGARASEAVRVLIGDVELDPGGGGNVKLHGKGRRIRYCPLWNRTTDELTPLMRDRCASDNLFLNRCRRPLTRFGVHSVVERHAKKAAETLPSLAKKRISPHTIRHTTATHLLRSGVDINTIRAWLGHVSLDTTNIYAEIDLEAKALALAACAPEEESTQKRRWQPDADLMKFLREL